MDECVLINESDQLSLVRIPQGSYSGMDKRSCHTQGPPTLHAGLNFETSEFPSWAKEIFKNGFKNVKNRGGEWSFKSFAKFSPKFTGVAISIFLTKLSRSLNFFKAKKVAKYRFVYIFIK